MENAEDFGTRLNGWIVALMTQYNAHHDELRERRIGLEADPDVNADDHDLMIARREENELSGRIEGLSDVYDHVVEELRKILGGLY